MTMSCIDATSLITSVTGTASLHLLPTEDHVPFNVNFNHIHVIQIFVDQCQYDQNIGFPSDPKLEARRIIGLQMRLQTDLDYAQSDRMSSRSQTFLQ